jgi:hypothetical protein
VRYWDGLTWTPHAQATQPGLPALRVDPRSVREWARRAPIAFWLLAACSAISAVATPYVFGRAFEDALDRNEPATINFGVGFGFGSSVALNLISLASLGATIALMVWGHHITATARALGLRTSHSPGWAAAGWLVPIINLWFPYQTVRDAFVPGHPARNMAGYWWGLHISTGILSFVGVLFAMGSPEAGAFVGAIGAVTALGAGYYGHELATAIGTTHVGMIERLSGVHVSSPL